MPNRLREQEMAMTNPHIARKKGTNKDIEIAIEIVIETGTETEETEIDPEGTEATNNSKAVTHMPKSKPTGKPKCVHKWNAYYYTSYL